jgi:hypothetical protein
VKYFGYATDNAGWSSSDRAIVVVARLEEDRDAAAGRAKRRRDVPRQHTVGHPTLRVSKFPLPGDPVMAMLQRVVIDVDTGKITRLQMEPTSTARRSATTSA